MNLIISNISVEQEKKLTNYLSFDFNISNNENRYLNEISTKLEKCAELPYNVKVFIMDDSNANAFALPGGTIYVTSGILKQLDSENELAFILGHELGHFKHKDHLRGLGKGLILSMITLLVGADNSLLNIGLEVGQAKYSQSDELKADKFGLEIMQCAYGSVTDASKFFEKMNKDDGWKYFLASHPSFSKRVDSINDIIEQNGYNTTKPAISLKGFDDNISEL